MATYTRKAFVSVADILNGFVEDIDKDVFEDLVHEFGLMFSSDNSNFDFEKFRTECVK
jgi:hypothetical protein